MHGEGEDGVLSGEIFPEGFGACQSVSTADVPLTDTKQVYGKRGYEKKECSNAGGTKREPDPQYCVYGQRELYKAYEYKSSLRLFH